MLEVLLPEPGARGRDPRRRATVRSTAEIDLDTGEVLDRALVGVLDLIERDAECSLVVVDSRPRRRSTRTQRDGAASLSLFRLVAEMLHAIEAGVIHLEHTPRVVIDPH
jgi:hypothetical protein